VYASVDALLTSVTLLWNVAVEILASIFAIPVSVYAFASTSAWLALEVASALAVLIASASAVSAYACADASAAFALLVASAAAVLIASASAASALVVASVAAAVIAAACAASALAVASFDAAVARTTSLASADAIASACAKYTEPAPVPSTTSKRTLNAVSALALVVISALMLNR